MKSQSRFRARVPGWLAALGVAALAVGTVAATQVAFAGTTPASTAAASTNVLAAASVTWPTKTGDVKVTGTISVTGTKDGGMKRYCCIGSGSQSEREAQGFCQSRTTVLRKLTANAWGRIDPHQSRKGPS